MAESGLKVTHGINFKAILDGDAGGDYFANFETNADDNGGQTEFTFGSSAVFRIYTNVTNYTLEVTDGSVDPSSMGTPTEDAAIEEDISFSGTEASTGKNYKPGSLQKISWTGIPKTPGAITEGGGNKITSNIEMFGTMKVSYTSVYYKHTLSGILKPEDYDEEADEGVEVMILLKQTA